MGVWRDLIPAMIQQEEFVMFLDLSAYSRRPLPRRLSQLWFDLMGSTLEWGIVRPEWWINRTGILSHYGQVTCVLIWLRKCLMHLWPTPSGTGEQVPSSFLSGLFSRALSRRRQYFLDVELRSVSSRRSLLAAGSLSFLVPGGSLFSFFLDWWISMHIAFFCAEGRMPSRQTEL